jgi:hypothetical protein
MGVCERLVVFEHRYGKRRSLAQRQAIRRGQRAHLQFYRNRQVEVSSNAHVVARIASGLYGWLRRALRGAAWPVCWCIGRVTKTLGRDDGN